VVNSHKKRWKRTPILTKNLKQLWNVPQARSYIINRKIIYTFKCLLIPSPTQSSTFTTPPLTANFIASEAEILGNAFILLVGTINVLPLIA
jgi:hypothetical protein